MTALVTSLQAKMLQQPQLDPLSENICLLWQCARHVGGDGSSASLQDIVNASKSRNGYLPGLVQEVLLEAFGGQQLEQGVAFEAFEVSAWKVLQLLAEAVLCEDQTWSQATAGFKQSRQPAKHATCRRPQNQIRKGSGKQPPALSSEEPLTSTLRIRMTGLAPPGSRRRCTAWRSTDRRFHR